MKYLKKNWISVIALMFVSIVGMNANQAITLFSPSNLEVWEIPTSNHPILEDENEISADVVKVTLVNHSDWTVRFKFIYKDGSQSGWTSAKAHSTGRSNSINKPVEGIKVKWLDIGKWKNIGGVALRYQSGNNWNYTVSGKVFPHKPISIK